MRVEWQDGGWEDGKPDRFLVPPKTELVGMESGKVGREVWGGVWERLERAGKGWKSGIARPSVVAAKHGVKVGDERATGKKESDRESGWARERNYPREDKVVDVPRLMEVMGKGRTTRHKPDNDGGTASVEGAVGGVWSHSRGWSTKREEVRELE